MPEFQFKSRVPLAFVNVVVEPHPWGVFSGKTDNRELSPHFCKLHEQFVYLAFSNLRLNAEMIQVTGIQNCVIFPNSTEVVDLEPEFLCLLLYYHQGKKK